MQRQATALSEGRPGRTDEPWAAPAWLVALATAIAYATVGGLALMLAGPPGYASPLYPSAGLALAATLTWGRAALPGVFLGALAVNTGLGLLRGGAEVSVLLLPALIGLGAALQAAVGATLIRRFVSSPVVLNSPRDILLAGLLGGVVASAVSASVAIPALLWAGALSPAQGLSNWLTWWVGDVLGALIAAPAVLCFIGRPRADWRPRRLSLGAPLIMALALVALAITELNRLDRERLLATFERDADRLASDAQSRLQVPLFALQALHGAARGLPALDSQGLAEAASWWLRQPRAPQAMGYSERVAAADILAFELRARAEGQAGYQVYQRDGGAALARDGEVVAIRWIEPNAGNAMALGGNVLSIPAARATVQATRRSGEPAASAGFKLLQSKQDETGLVLYQALYNKPAGDEAARQAAFRGVVFVTVRAEALFDNLVSAGKQYMQWCLVDPAEGVERRHIAGPAGCEDRGLDPASFRGQRALQIGGRSFELRLDAQPSAIPLQQKEGQLLLSLVGLSAASLLGTLLLILTGHSRRTELVVQARTGELRQEMDDRSQAQQALHESEMRLRTILDHAPIGVMFLDDQRRLLECNPRLCAMLGKSPQQLRGSTLEDHTQFADDSDMAALTQQPSTPRKPEAVMGATPMRLRHSDGSTVWVQVSTTELQDAHGAAGRSVAVVQDITEQLRLEAFERALHQAQAASLAKSEFVSRMSHELRTPLNAMIGFSQLLGMDREPALAGHQREWTQQIQRAGWHLLEMINETLDLARIETGTVQLTLKPVALAPLLAATRILVAGAASQRGIVLHEQLARGASAVLGDSTRLKQVLTNLLSNAVKYNHEGGSVSVAASSDGDGWVTISVTDTGMGMSPEQLASLFQPYNRLGREASNIEGTGIGLVISRRLAELMGGTLEASSTAGQGTRFTLRLRAAQAPAAPDLPLLDAASANQRQRKVHYVEDNPTNVEVMRGVLLQRPQLSLSVSSNGLDGLEAIRRQLPDLVLLDMQLPDISGLELLRHLKNDSDLTRISVIVVSADATKERMQEALTLGALHYVTKPLGVSGFLMVLDDTLESLDTRWGM